MPRIRSIKPQFWRSPDVMELDYFQRLLYIGLWNLADDEGRGAYDPVSISADLFLKEFSLNPREVAVEVSNGFKKLFKLGMIELFKHNDRIYFEVVHWSDHQKVNNPTPSKIPPSTSGSSITEDSLSPTVVLPPGIRNKEEGVRSKEITRSSDDEPVFNEQPQPAPTPKRPTYPDAFLEWWNLYPRKQGKRQALKAWRKATNRVDPERLMEATKTFARFHEADGTEKRFIPMPATWLNRDGWDDELISRRDTTTSHPSGTRPEDWLTSTGTDDRNVVDGEVVPDWTSKGELPW